MWILGRKGPSGFSACSTAEQVTQGIDATGLTAIVTGASSGIGTETARVLALHGVHVIMAVRNVDSGRKVKEAILKEKPEAKIDVMELDLGSMESVRKFASEYKSSGLPLNLLINNAGVMAPPFMLTQDNIELQFGTNHIGHFLLTNLLLETMKSTARESQKEGRIVNLSSEGHRYAYREGIRFDKINDESSYSTIYAYGQSKLANVLHANELARRLKVIGFDFFLATGLVPKAYAIVARRACSTPSTDYLPLEVRSPFTMHPKGSSRAFCFIARGLKAALWPSSWGERKKVWEITANSLHPGAIATNLLRHHSFIDGLVNLVGKYLLKNVPQGAATTCYVALHPQVKGVSGEYFSDSNIAKPSSLSQDAELAKKLWDFSVTLTDPK
ncbi:NAD(P)-binding Rossmann-fold superfamily protein [Actinidia rufa]|uniref:NAD(P)-binding Rossmann-fold superfamily protein n=1 Tax=Actinidia rufa TaxID=165716 RepID=A0A7J0G7V4_9ERIC|nr:NAD(P)-binding Rossmann-fold superfamily protein [Actinidia rufa]